MNEFEKRVEAATGRAGLCGADLSTIQVNVGLKCDLACTHCHVASSPRRKEMMSWETMTYVLEAARRARSSRVDITGGAPELNPRFRQFVTASRGDGFEVLVRTNLTIFFAPGLEDVPEFYREQRVHLVASLPCYLEKNVDGQRGNGVFKGSIRALRRLNELGYGIDPHLPLDLVYNPVGPQLPPSQAGLAEAYKQELGARYGVSFTRLLTIANMPIGRFLGDLKKQNGHQTYAVLLREAFNPRTLDNLMCRYQVSVGWDGTVYDCDFNLALRLAVQNGSPAGVSHIRDFDPSRLMHRRIRTGPHCFGCTAGCGSSCGGALTDPDTQGR